MYFFVYILACEEGKYYVGATKKKVEIRFDEHSAGMFGSSMWCKKYPPIRVIQAKNYSNELEMLVYERLTTFEMMKQKGYENVRGANFCQLKEIDVKHLSWDMAQLTGDDARSLIRNLRPNGPMESKYADLIEKELVKSKFFG